MFKDLYVNNLVKMNTIDRNDRIEIKNNQDLIQEATIIKKDYESLNNLNFKGLLDDNSYNDSINRLYDNSISDLISNTLEYSTCYNYLKLDNNEFDLIEYISYNEIYLDIFDNISIRDPMDLIDYILIEFNESYEYNLTEKDQEISKDLVKASYYPNTLKNNGGA